MVIEKNPVVWDGFQLSGSASLYYGVCMELNRKLQQWKPQRVISVPLEAYSSN